MKAVENSGEALEYASEELNADRDVVLEAVTNSGIVLKSAPESLKKDKEIVLAAIKSNGASFLFVDNSLEKDKDILALLEEIGYDEEEMIYDLSMSEIFIPENMY